MPKIDHFSGNLCESVRQEVSGSITLVGCISGEVHAADLGPFLVTPVANCLPKEKGIAKICVLVGFESNSGKVQEQLTIGELEVESLTQTYLPSDPVIFDIEEPGFIYFEVMELPSNLDVDNMEKDSVHLRKLAVSCQMCARIEIHTREE